MGLPTRSFVYVEPQGLRRLKQSKINVIRAFSQPYESYTQSVTLSLKQLIEMIDSKKTAEIEKEIKYNRQYDYIHVYALEKKYLTFD